jgi:hypothetical protein
VILKGMASQPAKNSVVLKGTISVMPYILYSVVP